MPRVKLLKILADLETSVRRGRPHDLTFAHIGGQNPQEQMDRQFRVWTETWILPRIEELRSLLEKKS